MDLPMRPAILDLIRVCETLAGDETVLTVREREAVARCIRELDKHVLPDRPQDDQPLASTLGAIPPNID
jgi:hypothetical protein